VICGVSGVTRQIGQGEIHIDQDELMDPMVWGAFFMHPDTGLTIVDEWIQVHINTSIR